MNCPWWLWVPKTRKFDSVHLLFLIITEKFTFRNSYFSVVIMDITMNPEEGLFATETCRMKIGNGKISNIKFCPGKVLYNIKKQPSNITHAAIALFVSQISQWWQQVTLKV